MPLRRKTIHRLSHRSCRKTSYQLTHGPRGPNYAGEAVVAFRRYIKLHRRLMKLVPEVFDYAIAHKLRQEKEEQEAYMQKVLPILHKVYGTGLNQENAPNNSRAWCKNGAEKVQHPLGHLSPAKRRKVDALYEEKILWLKAGSIAMDSFKKYNRRLISFSLLCKMLEAGVTLGRLVSGLETNLQIDPPQHFLQRDPMADLERIYGPVCHTSDACSPRGIETRVPGR